MPIALRLNWIGTGKALHMALHIGSSPSITAPAGKAPLKGPTAGAPIATAAPAAAPVTRAEQSRRAARDVAWAGLVGSLGAVVSMSFAALGAGYGMAKAALGVVRSERRKGPQE